MGAMPIPRGLIRVNAEKGDETKSTEAGSTKTTTTGSTKPMAPHGTSGKASGASSSRRSGSNGTPPGMPGGPMMRGPSPTQIVAGHAVYTGLLGTLALFLGQSVFQEDLFSMFSWSDTGDYALAAALLIPLQVANVAILAPDWSSWKLPKPESMTQEQQEEAAASLLSKPASPIASPTAATGSSTTGSSASSSSSSSSSAPAPAQGEQAGAAGEVTVMRSQPLGLPPGLPPNAVAVGEEVEEEASSSSSSRGASPAPAPAPLAAPLAASSSADATSSTAASQPAKSPSPPPDSKVKLVDASKWGAAPPAPPKPAFALPTARTLRDAAHLAQGHYVANNPTAQIPVSVEAGVAVLDSLAGELMFRGVLVGGVAAFLRDQAYEQGCDDFLAVPRALSGLFGPEVVVQGAAGDAAAAAGMALVALDDVTRWVAGMAIVVGLAALAGRKVARSRVRVAMMTDIAERMAMIKGRSKKDSKKGSAAAAAASKAVADAVAEAVAAATTSKDAGASNASSSSSAASADAKTGTSEAADSAVSASTSTPPAATGSGPAPVPTEAPSSSSGGSAPSGLAGSSLPQQPAKAADTTSASPAPEAPAPATTSSGSSSGGAPPGKASSPGPAKKMLPGLIPMTMTKGPQAPSLNQPQVLAVGQLDAITWAAALQGGRDLLQTATLTAVFVSSGGNLAASFAASVINQLVFSALQRVGLERARKKSSELAAEMEEINLKLRSIVTKRGEQIKEIQAAKAKEGGSAATTSSSSSSDSAAAESARSAPTSFPLDGVIPPGGNSTNAPQPPAAAEAAAPAAPAAAAVAEAPAAAPAAAAAPATGIQRTLSMLDMLVPAPPAPPPKKQAPAKQEQPAQQAAPAQQEQGPGSA